MWTMLGTLVLGLLKWIVTKKAKKRLNDKQFIEFIEAHQNRRIGAGKTANAFDEALAETLAKMEAEEKEKES